MMKKLLCIGFVVAVAAVTADAAVLSTWAQGALRLKLRVDYKTGEAWLIDQNSATQGGVVTDALDLDGYTVTSTAGNLVPTLTWNTTTKTVTNGWFSIADSVAKRTVATMTALGDGVLAFGRLGNPPGTANNISEGNSSGTAYLRLDTASPDVPWSIGIPLKPNKASYQDLSFTYHSSTLGGNVYTGVIELVNMPEPATMGVLAIGGIGMLLRKRRRH